MERFTITKTRRYGHQDTQISHIYSATREKTKWDAVIRIADFCGLHGIDLAEAIKIKSDYNKTRAYRHGQKICWYKRRRRY